MRGNSRGGNLFRTSNKPKAIQDLSGDQVAGFALRSAVEVKEITCIRAGMRLPSDQWKALAVLCEF